MFTQACELYVVGGWGETGHWDWVASKRIVAWRRMLWVLSQKANTGLDPRRAPLFGRFRAVYRIGPDQTPIASMTVRLGGGVVLLQYKPSSIQQPS